MLRIIAVALFASLCLLPSAPLRADIARQPTVADRDGPARVQTVGYRYRMFRGSAYSSTGRRPGTGFTPWYLLPPTDPRRYNGPHYYWNK